MAKKAISIISGGMDSALSSFIAKNDGYEIVGVHFNYGQRTQNRELQAYRLLCNELGVINSYEIELNFFKQIGASSLVDKKMEVPTSGLEDGVPNTYVPFRNGIFLSIAAAIAEKEKAEAIYIGVVAKDSSGYPDCTSQFIKKQESAINEGTKQETQVKIKMPLVAMTKAQIVQSAIKMNVPLQFTWSCYQDEDVACGVCDSCRLRLRGFELAGCKDPIAYKKVPNSF